LCSLVIIKKRDAEYLLDVEIRNADDQQDAIDLLYVLGCKHVIIQEDILPQYSHGLGNSLSSAIATYLSKGASMDEAVGKAKDYINQQVVLASDLSGRSSELYNAFINEVIVHYRTNSDVFFYADCLNVSSRYLAQVTKRISGKSPKAIIDEYLIREIERQLTTTSKTVQELAYDFGFSSQAHFAKFFKKIDGITPSQFRKNK
jgi:hydroxymethylpyrimidine/phosphomethylpyrimidine kinase